MSPVRIAAVADVHSPRYLNEFRAALSNCERPDLFLFAGDMINRGKADEYSTVLDTIESFLGSDIPIVACFGNEEPLSCRDEVHRITQEKVTFLDEQEIMLHIQKTRIAVVGMSATNIELNETKSPLVSEMRTSFENRARRLSELLMDTSQKADHVILLLHFSPLNENDSTKFSWWVSKAIERTPPTLILHGHVHDQIRNEIQIGATTIQNVALPAIGAIKELNV